MKDDWPTAQDHNQGCRGAENDPNAQRDEQDVKKGRKETVTPFRDANGVEKKLRYHSVRRSGILSGFDIP